MTCSRARVLGTLFFLSVVLAARASAQSPLDLSGSWTLNHSRSEFPQEVGFSLTDTSGSPTSGRGGRRGGRGGGGTRADEVKAPRVQPQTQEDAQRVRYLTDEVRLPYEHLTIAVTPAMVTLTPDRAAVRTLHPGKRDEEVDLGPVTAIVNATWEAPTRLAIVYKAETNRLLRYTYTLSEAPRQLTVEIEFAERGVGDKVKRVYEPTVTAADPASASSIPPSSLVLPPGATGSVGRSSAPLPAMPAAPARAAGLDQRPDAALRGLTRLGVVVDGVGAQAVACGLKQDAIEAAVAKRLTDAGLRVVRDSDDDTYLYVGINTVSASAGLCVSRYDVTLYSHAAAQLPHTAAPVLLQAELLHGGGIAGGGPTTHAAGVMKSLLEYVEQFATRVRSASQ
jgi:hypothetical protein